MYTVDVKGNGFVAEINPNGRWNDAVAAVKRIPGRKRPADSERPGGGVMGDLILSLFPGIGLLDRAFEEEGYCVVRGPDVLWGGDIHRFHPPAGRFDGVIGGPPCQAFSRLVHMVRHTFGEEKVAPNLIPEFERCVAEAQPTWFLMENVPAAPDPQIAGYEVATFMLNNRWLKDATSQNRLRKFCFGHRQGALDLTRHMEFAALEPLQWDSAVLAAGTRNVQVRMTSTGKMKKSIKNGATRRDVEESLRLQGLPADFFGKKTPFTVAGQQMMIGNGVPLPMGRALARAIQQALSN